MLANPLLIALYSVTHEHQHRIDARNFIEFLVVMPEAGLWAVTSVRFSVGKSRNQFLDERGFSYAVVAKQGNPFSRTDDQVVDSKQFTGGNVDG